MILASRLYVGQVLHLRRRPRVHRLRYGCFWMLLDLDELPGLARRWRLFGYNRAALFSLWSRDHGDGKSTDLRRYVDQRLAEAGIDLAGGAVRLLSMPRVAGYVFNPLSVYFCHRPDGRLGAVIYEVTNTYRERHSYLIEVADPDARVISQRCAKGFYVSPFMDAELAYDFRVEAPGEDLTLVIRTSDREGPLLLASMWGKAAAITDARLMGLMLRQPFLTMKVIAAIHWEAMMLWLKGIKVRAKPAPPAHSLTIVRNQPADAAESGPVLGRGRPMRETGQPT
ncbi:MAG: DUF1365 domain-containing protein [Hyphomicrobiaceae bacterium]